MLLTSNNLSVSENSQKAVNVLKDDFNSWIQLKKLMDGLKVNLST